MTYWIQKAKDFGFDTAVALDPQAMEPREDVRAMCAENKCGAYGHNWTCPPAIGSLEQCRDRLRQYKAGILLQTVGILAKTIDSRGYREAEQQHNSRLSALAEEVRAEHPDALILGAGGCRVCSRCAYPQPCRYPQKALSSMEAYGLFVTQVCRDAGAAYHHGARTVTYTACVLIK